MCQLIDNIYSLLPAAVRSIAISMSVCLSVRIISKTTCPNFEKFSMHATMLTMAVALSSSDDNAICFVLSVLWMSG